MADQPMVEAGVHRFLAKFSGHQESIESAPAPEVDAPPRTLQRALTGSVVTQGTVPFWDLVVHSTIPAAAPATIAPWKPTIPAEHVGITCDMCDRTSTVRYEWSKMHYAPNWKPFGYRNLGERCGKVLAKWFYGDEVRLAAKFTEGDQSTSHRGLANAFYFINQKRKAYNNEIRAARSRYYTTYGKYPKRRIGGKVMKKMLLAKVLLELRPSTPL